MSGVEDESNDEQVGGDEARNGDNDEGIDKDDSISSISSDESEAKSRIFGGPMNITQAEPRGYL